MTSSRPPDPGLQTRTRSHTASPGDVYFLEREEVTHDHAVLRPHVVLTTGDLFPGVRTVAYCSKQRTEADEGAPHVVVERTSALFHLTGFSDTTYVYASRLVACESSDLVDRRGRVVDEFPQLRDEELRHAVGLGTGTSGERGPAAESRRGAIALFQPDFAEMVGTAYGLIVTWPPYSKKGAIQNFIPIFSAAEYETNVPRCVVAEGTWTAPMANIGRAFFMVPLVQSAYEPDDIAGYLPQPVDGSTMRLIDEALSEHLYGESR